MVSRHERFWQQLAEVEKQHGRKLGVFPPTASDDNDVKPRYVYEPAELLCHPSHVDRVMPGVTARVNRRRDCDEHVVALELETGADVHQEANNVIQADKARNNGVETPGLATPNHWVSITPVDMCPADEPAPRQTDIPWPPLNPDPGAGHGITVLVIDTGVFEGFEQGHDWLSNVVKPFKQDSRIPFEPADDIFVGDTHDEHKVIKEYAGHGTFCAGVVGAAAPGATLRIAKAFERAGALPECELGQVLLERIEKHGWPDIISLSAGVATKDGLPLKGLEKFINELAQHPETLLIAAAGNDAERDDVGQGDYHFQPASLAFRRDGSIVSVGALREQADERACFSNYGTSVTVYARGENHVNAFLHGPYIYHHDGTGPCHNFDPALYQECTCTTGQPLGTRVTFDGMARWSGTSFATPLVAGMLAAHMAATPELGPGSSRRAIVDLIGKKAQAVGDIHASGEQFKAFL